MVFPGPAPLGRGIVHRPGQQIPPACRHWPKVVVGEAEVADPAEVLEELHGRWLGREPVAVELGVDPAMLQVPQRCLRAPWELSPSFEFPTERLHFLVWANNWDLRSGTPLWWWSRKAQRLGAALGGPADVLLEGARPAWIDGGARGPLEGIGDHGLLHWEAVEAGRLELDRRAEAPTGLADDQAAAVTHGSGPARVIAPAGSGKTRVLSERLRHLVQGRGWQPESVAAVAFNRRAAAEMSERCEGLDVRIRTLNSLGLAICSGTGPFLRPASAPKEVAAEAGVRSLLESLLRPRHRANTDPLAPYLDGLRLIRLGLVPPPVAEEQAAAPGLAELFETFRRSLSEAGLIDFDGQVYEAIAVLLSDPDARRAARRACRHLAVDELQDMTPAHMLLLRLLAAPTYDVFGVGDDDQVIYGFAGATPSFLLDFERYFPGAADYRLGINYRCPPAVVTAANRLLAHNRHRVPKSTRPAPSRSAGRGELRVARLRPEDHAAAAMDFVEELVGQGVRPADIAVLARVRSLLLPAQLAAAERRLALRKPLGVAVLERTGLRAALAWLRLAHNPHRMRGEDLAEAMRRPRRAISAATARFLAPAEGTSLEEMSGKVGHCPARERAAAAAFVSDLAALADLGRQGDAGRVLAYVRNDIGLGKAMDRLDSSSPSSKRSAHAEDLAALSHAASLHPSLESFESWLRSNLSYPGDPAGVELSTIHRVKGRQWRAVVLLGADQGVLPHRRSADIEEERRVFHVAITRCEERLVVLADGRRPSRFVSEMASASPPPASPPPASPAPPPGPVPAPELLEALRAWRRQRAAADGVPAYVVFSDAQLEGIASASPSCSEELAACRGVGPTRLDRYGEELLGLLASLSGR